MSLPGNGSPESLIAPTATTAAARSPSCRTRPARRCGPDPLGPERRVLPVPSPPFGHHVCVCLEEQGLAGPVSIPHRPHVRASRRDLLRADLEAFVFEVVNEEPGNTGLVAVRFLGTVDARDADELLHEACQLLAVYSSQHRFEQVPEFVFSEPLRARLRQRLSDAAQAYSSPVSA